MQTPKTGASERIGQPGKKADKFQHSQSRSTQSGILEWIDIPPNNSLDVLRSHTVLHQHLSNVPPCLNAGFHPLIWFTEDGT
jgi:hypothetical protein